MCGLLSLHSHYTRGQGAKDKSQRRSKAQPCLWEHCHLPNRRQDLVFSWHYHVFVPGPCRRGNGQKMDRMVETASPPPKGLKPEWMTINPRVLQWEKLESGSSPYVTLRFRCHRKFTYFLKEKKSNQISYLLTTCPILMFLSHHISSWVYLISCPLSLKGLLPTSLPMKLLFLLWKVNSVFPNLQKTKPKLKDLL